MVLDELAVAVTGTSWNAIYPLIRNVTRDEWDNVCSGQLFMGPNMNISTTLINEACQHDVPGIIFEFVIRYNRHVVSHLDILIAIGHRSIPIVNILLYYASTEEKCKLSVHDYSTVAPISPRGG